MFTHCDQKLKVQIKIGWPEARSVYPVNTALNKFRYNNNNNDRTFGRSRCRREPTGVRTSAHAEAGGKRSTAERLKPSFGKIKLFVRRDRERIGLLARLADVRRRWSRG